MEHIVQTFGLIVALCFILFSVDDLFWDVFSIIRKIKHGEIARLPIENLDDVPPKLLAVMFAAWHEDNVIESVIDNMIASVQYPQSMYHVFIGVYPNDGPTIDAVQRLEQKYGNVHMVVNSRPGPTCKADNINNIIRNIKQFEAAHQWRFSSVTVHDSEDVVHPYELKLTNYLDDFYEALQFPVIPLQKFPSFKNIFQGMTTGTYADEFAENHYRTMSTREALSAVVPSAGTGFVISHDILDDFGDEPLFPEDSLTEDYKLSLILAKRGYKIHYVLEKLPRLISDNRVRWDYVATRSFFPETFKTAVRQKTRWIYGITMQSVKIADMFRPSRLGFAGRYSLYKDLKAKASNMIMLPGYLVFIYFVTSLFVKLPMMYPRHSLAWELCVFLTFLMIFRQFMRAVSILNFYGFRSMVVACLLPPLMPIRLVWGNTINMSATFCAWKQYFLGTGKKRKTKKVAWAKTDHTFLNQHVLYRYYRHIGDVLLEKQYIDVTALSAALQKSRRDGLRLGDMLLRDGLVSEEQLMEAVANVQHQLFVRHVDVFGGSVAQQFDPRALEKLLVYPVFKADGSYVIARTDFSPVEEMPGLLGIEVDCCHFVYTTRTAILEALVEPDRPARPEYAEISLLLSQNRITWEQAVLAMDRHHQAPDILLYMGLSDELKLPDVMSREIVSSIV